MYQSRRPPEHHDDSLSYIRHPGILDQSSACARLTEWTPHMQPIPLLLRTVPSATAIDATRSAAAGRLIVQDCCHACSGAFVATFSRQARIAP